MLRLVYQAASNPPSLCRTPQMLIMMASWLRGETRDSDSPLNSRLQNSCFIGIFLLSSSAFPSAHFKPPGDTRFSLELIIREAPRRSIISSPPCFHPPVPSLSDFLRFPLICFFPHTVIKIRNFTEEETQRDNNSVLYESS